MVSAALVLALYARPVRAQSPLPAIPDRPVLGSTITVDLLPELPTSVNLFSFFDAAQPDLISDRLDTGGLTPATPARMGAHGSSWTQTRFRVGSANMTDPEDGGAPLLLPDVYSWDHVDVMTGMVPVEANAPGLAIGLEPRRAGASWLRILDGLISRPGMVSQGAITPPPIARLRAFSHANLFVGGPIVPGRLGVAATATWTKSSLFERDDPLGLDAYVGSVFTHLTFTPTAEDAGGLVVWAQRSQAPLANRTAFGAQAARRDTGVHVQWTWEHRVEDVLSWMLMSSYTERNRARAVGPSAAIVVERLSDGPVPAALNPRVGTDRTWSIGGRLIPPAATILGRRHTVRAGGEASGDSARTRAGFSGLVGELVDGLPARVWDYSSAVRESRWAKTTALLYASDRIEVLPRMQLDAGVRYQSARGSASGSGDRIRWNSWLPRASLRCDITRAGEIAAFAGFGRYGYELPLDYLAYGDPAAPAGNIYRWNTNRAGSPQPSEIGELVARIGPGAGDDPTFSAIDPALKQPYMDEFIVGIESRPRRAAVIRLAAVARREQRLVGVLNVGVPVTSYSVASIPDPGVDLGSTADDQLLPAFNRLRSSFGRDRYLLTNPADDRATFVGVDITARTNTRHLFLIGGATAGRSGGLSGNRGFQAIENDQGIIGEAFTDPNAATNARGRLFTERAYTVKLAGVYRLPRDVRLGMLARYQDGQPFARLVIVPALNQGPEAIRAFPNGRTRFTYSMTMDLRLQKGFAIGGYRLDAIVDAYNLLNSAKEIEEFTVTPSNQRLTSAVQPPRAIHAGVRITF